MSNGLPWFPCEPTPLLAALAQMQPAEGYVYCVMLLRIYECGGACPDDIHAIANRCRYSERVTTEALNRLFKAGRLVRGEGGIHNPKADAVIESSRALLQKRIVAGKKGGSRRAENHQRNQQNGSSNATVLLKQKPRHIQTQEQTPLFPEGGNNAQQPPVYTDAKHELWGEGTAILDQLGLPSRRSRPIIGRWLRDCDDDAQRVLAAIQRAREARVIDPVPWITRALKTGGTNGTARTDRDTQTDHKGGFGSFALKRAREASEDRE